MHRNATLIIVTKGQQRLKKNDQLFNLMFLFFYFVHSNVADSKCHKQKWRTLFFTRIRLVARVLACARAIGRNKWIRLCRVSIMCQKNRIGLTFHMDTLK